MIKFFSHENLAIESLKKWAKITLDGQKRKFLDILTKSSMFLSNSSKEIQVKYFEGAKAKNLFKKN